MTPWQPGTIDNVTGAVTGIGGARREAAMVSSSLATVYLQLGQDPGEVILKPTALKLESTVAKPPSYEVEGLKLTINQEGGVKIETIKVAEE